MRTGQARRMRWSTKVVRDGSIAGPAQRGDSARRHGSSGTGPKGRCRLVRWPPRAASSPRSWPTAARTEASTNPNCIVRVDWWPYWLESVYAKGPMEWKISLLWSWDDGRIDWSQSMQYFFDNNRILKFIWKIEKCARCCCNRRKIELKKNPRYMLLHWTNLLQLFITRSFTPNFHCYCILGSNVTQLYFIINLLSW